MFDQRVSLLGSGQLELLDAAPEPTALIREPGTRYGEVFTRPWVVEMILDLVGYRSDLDLVDKVAVEPSCGTGAFLLPLVDRLISSAQVHGHRLESIGPAIRAYDLLDANVQLARKAVVERLLEAGMNLVNASAIAVEWVTTGDFLLADELPAADYVVGNPPYIRLEDVAPPVMKRYRARYSAMRGRSDIYVGFIERGLSLLRAGGTLGFICADRWMRNQYGAALRELIGSRFAVDAVISMHEVDAFEDEVSAYPAVAVLRRGPQRFSVIGDTNRAFDRREAAELRRWMAGKDGSKLELPGLSAAKLVAWPRGRDMWPAGDPETLELLSDLESRFSPLEDERTGTRVGIGLATGCDAVYLTRDSALVESERLLPMLKAADTASGRAVWSGTYLVNPWDEYGMVDLRDYPRLAAYFEANREKLCSRHVARKRPGQWYRTIDRVDSSLTGRPKLLFPDLKGAANPVLEDGAAYPHHNLYFVVSDKWDLEVLGGILLSEVANLFVGAYCVRMRGGCYRFQAQYLRRIRVPNPESLSCRQEASLATAFRERDVESATRVALELYCVDRLPSRLGRW